MKLKYLISYFLIGFLVSCADEPLPFETFEELQKGAFPRLLETDGGSFFFTDPENSSFNFTVEYFDENNGQNISSHDWWVRHRNNVDDTTSDAILLEGRPASSFGTNAKSGLPEATFEFTLPQIMAAMGKTIDDFNGGDDIIIDGIITLNDGRTFGPDNSGAAVQGGAGFDGIFRFIKPLLCTSSLDGVYDAQTETPGWCGGTWTGQIELVQTGDGEYDLISIDDTHPRDAEAPDFSMGAYWACYGTDATLPGGNLKLVDACEKLSYSGQSRWGETYIINSLTINGPNLTIDWQNDYPPESGVTTLTRTDGSSWPNFKF